MCYINHLKRDAAFCDSILMFNELRLQFTTVNKYGRKFPLIFYYNKIKFPYLAFTNLIMLPYLFVSLYFLRTDYHKAHFLLIISKTTMLLEFKTIYADFVIDNKCRRE